MRLFLSLSAIAILSGIGFSAVASQEGTLPLATFRLESPDNPTVGRVVVKGSQTYPDFTSLEAFAFGKHFVLTQAQLKLLRGFSPNGAQLSQISPGFSSPGGMVYLVLTNGFMSGEPARRFIVFTPSGNVGVGGRP
jgi:hypothetical protein